MAKGIDPKFVHYGIRKDYLAMIEAICEKEDIDFGWLSEDILKVYHAKNVDVIVYYINRTHFYHESSMRLNIYYGRRMV